MIAKLFRRLIIKIYHGNLSLLRNKTVSILLKGIKIVPVAPLPHNKYMYSKIDELNKS